MKKNILSTVLLFSFVFGNLVLNNITASASVSDVKKLYVAVDGDDSGNGSFSDPFKTMDKALDKVEDIARRYPNSSVVIYFREGTYRFSERVEIKNKLSNDNILKIKAYDNENVVFSGAREFDVSSVNLLTDSAVTDKIRCFNIVFNFILFRKV